MEGKPKKEINLPLGASAHYKRNGTFNLHFPMEAFLKYSNNKEILEKYLEIEDILDEDITKKETTSPKAIFIKLLTNISGIEMQPRTTKVSTKKEVDVLMEMVATATGKTIEEVKEMMATKEAKENEEKATEEEKETTEETPKEETPEEDTIEKEAEELPEDTEEVEEDNKEDETEDTEEEIKEVSN